MNKSILNNLLKEYEQKRLTAVRDAENRKKNLYLSNPKLQEIDDTLSNISITAAKSILQNNSEETLKNLKNKIDTLKKEKERILHSLNIDGNYFLPKYDCDICKDTGFIFEDGTSTMCNCLKQNVYNIEFNQLNSTTIDNSTFSNFNYNLYSDVSDEKKYGSNISPRENILDIKNAAQNFIKNFDNSETKNLIFTGGTGLRQNFFIKLYC